MEQLDLDFGKPVKHWGDWYDENPGVQGIWTRASFGQLLKTKRAFFTGSVLQLRNGTFVLPALFEKRLNEWLVTHRVINNVGVKK